MTKQQLIHGALTGLVGAATADFMAFRSFKTWQDVATFAWGVALLRWVAGAATGVIAAAGLGAL